VVLEGPQYLEAAVLICLDLLDFLVSNHLTSYFPLWSHFQRPVFQISDLSAGTWAASPKKRESFHIEMPPLIF
jgi:hypothetical protein